MCVHEIVEVPSVQRNEHNIVHLQVRKYHYKIRIQTKQLFIEALFDNRASLNLLSRRRIIGH